MGAILGLPIVALLAGTVATPVMARQPAFTATNVPLPKKVFDLGVAYVDEDSVPDLFTTAHDNRQVVLIGDGTGGFVDRISELSLDHTPAFPGYEDIDVAPPLASPGLYVYATKRGLSLVAHGASAKGRLASRGFGRVIERRGAHAVMIGRNTGELSPRRVRFRMAAGGALSIPMNPRAVPVRVRVAKPTATNSIFVGSRALSPDRPSFRLFLRDRHGMAWNDLDGDGDTDTYIVRGGLSGSIEEHPNLVQDQLMIRSGGGFVDRTAESGIRKGTCRGRAAAALDVDEDGRIDLFSSCRSAPPRLYLRRGTGFRNASTALAAAGARGSGMEWIDVRGDPSLELVAVEQGSLRVLGRARGGWAVLQRAGGLPSGQMLASGVADFDRDGDPDLLYSSDGGTTLLRNRDGRLVAEDPSRHGLPAAATDALAWVDFDNDGRLDLFATGAGLLRQRENGRFVASGLIAASGLHNARSVWPDVDGDGDRDGIVTARAAGRESTLYLNDGATGHWLEVEVAAPDGSDAVGARVRVRTGTSVQTGWVGQSDSARFSAGDYRLYFGLGSGATVDRLVVRWPDGAELALENVSGDRLLRLAHP